MPKTKSGLVQFAPIAELTPYARNARTHSPEQIEQLVKSMHEFGWTVPALIDEQGGLIAGHGRIMAAGAIYAAGGSIRMASGEPIPAGMVPLMRAVGWSEAKRKAYVIADNKLAMNAGWDEALLKLELADLKLGGFNLELTGFGELELKTLFDPAAQSGGAGSLTERFMVAPFSVLNAREGWWQDRKRAWLALGIQSELGRGDTAVNSPHEGKGMADGLVAVREKQKRGRKADAMPGGGGPNSLYRKGLGKTAENNAKRIANATPGGSALPAADYSKRRRGDGRGRAIGEG